MGVSSGRILPLLCCLNLGVEGEGKRCLRHQCMAGKAGAHFLLLLRPKDLRGTTEEKKDTSLEEQEEGQSRETTATFL